MHAIDKEIHAHLLGKGRRLVTRAEVVKIVGKPRRADSFIQARKQQGRWHEVQVGVYLIGLGPLTPHEERLAALLALPKPAALSQLCAYVEWDLDGLKAAPNEITVPHSTHVALTGAVTVHRSRRDEGFVEKGDLVVTSVERTLLESAPRLARPVLEKGFTSAWRRGLTSPEKLMAYVEEFGSANRRGTRQVRALAATYADGQRAPGSAAEVELFDLLRPALAEARIEEPVRQFELRLPDGTSATLDAAWPERRKAVEPAGLQWHGNTTAQAYDYRRRALAREIGWEIEPVAPVALRDQPRDTIATLIRFLQAPPLPLWVQNPRDVA